MTQGEFEDLVRYVSDNIDYSLDRYAMRMVEYRSPIPYDLAVQIDDRAEEWCNGVGIDPDEYYGEFGAEDVFMHEAYAFDS